MESQQHLALHSTPPSADRAIGRPERVFAKLARRLKPTWVIDYQDDIVTRTSIPGALSKRLNLWNYRLNNRQLRFSADRIVTSAKVESSKQDQINIGTTHLNEWRLSELQSKNVELFFGTSVDAEEISAIKFTLSKKFDCQVQAHDRYAALFRSLNQAANKPVTWGLLVHVGNKYIEAALTDGEATRWSGYRASGSTKLVSDVQRYFESVKHIQISAQQAWDLLGRDYNSPLANDEATCSVIGQDNNSSQIRTAYFDPIDLYGLLQQVYEPCYELIADGKRAFKEQKGLDSKAKPERRLPRLILTGPGRNLASLHETLLRKTRMSPHALKGSTMRMLLSDFLRPTHGEKHA
jgi:hypothetical protein